jgi:hypothetical protein
MKKRIGLVCDPRCPAASFVPRRLWLHRLQCDLLQVARRKCHRLYPRRNHSLLRWNAHLNRNASCRPIAFTAPNQTVGSNDRNRCPKQNPACTRTCLRLAVSECCPAEFLRLHLRSDDRKCSSPRPRVLANACMRTGLQFNPASLRRRPGLLNNRARRSASPHLLQCTRPRRQLPRNLNRPPADMRGIVTATERGIDRDQGIEIGQRTFRALESEKKACAERSRNARAPAIRPSEKCMQLREIQPSVLQIILRNAFVKACA